MDAQAYIRDILQKVIPEIRMHNLILFQDRDGTHYCEHTRNHLKRVGIPILDVPGISNLQGEPLESTASIKWWLEPSIITEPYRSVVLTNGPNSPDLSIWETLAGPLENQFERQGRCQSAKQAWERWLQIQLDYPEEKVEALFTGYRARLVECINRKGQRTRW